MSRWLSGCGGWPHVWGLPPLAGGAPSHPYRERDHVDEEHRRQLLGDYEADLVALRKRVRGITWLLALDVLIIFWNVLTIGFQLPTSAPVLNAVGLAVAVASTGYIAW